MNQPDFLKKGSRVALIAPASPVSEKELSNSLDSLDFLNLKHMVYPSVMGEHGYLAGKDLQRAEDINDAFSDPSIDGIFCIRGGYGCLRILPFLDYPMIKKNPKIFLGYSDISILQIALMEKSDLITLQGPMPSINWSRTDALTLNYLKTCLFGPSKESLTKETLIPLYKGTAQGPIVGGNLSRIVSTLGTPYEIDTKGKILFIEEINEKIFDVDKMLTSLSLAGKFRDCNGIILGYFENCQSVAPEKWSPLSLMEVIEEIILPHKKPTLSSLRAGHIYPNITFAIGKTVTIENETLFFHL